jgi:LysM repeat protein
LKDQGGSNVNSLKPLILMIVLGGVAFGVYRSLTRGPAELPPGVDPSAIEPVDLQLPSFSDSRSAKTPDTSVLSPLSEASKNKPLPLTRPDAAHTTAPPFNASESAGLGNAAPAGESTGQRSSIATPFGAPPENPQAGSQPSPASAISSFAIALKQIENRLAAGQLTEALRELSAWYGDPQLTPAEQVQLQQLLNNLAGTVIYSREHHFTQPHKVQPGERLEDIAKKYNVTAELLAKINGISETAPIVPGEDIKVVKGPFSAVIDVNKRQFTLLLDGAYAGSFQLGDLGAAVAKSSQPIQELTITQKTVGPIYNGPAGEIPPGDPSNPLGQRLLGLGNEFALHGAPKTPSQQRTMPEGGIRLSDQDLVEVFDILTVGSRVTIRR